MSEEIIGWERHGRGGLSPIHAPEPRGFESLHLEDVVDISTKRKFVVSFNDTSVSLGQVCRDLYLAGTRTDVFTDEISLEVTCFVKEYRVEEFLKAVADAGGVCKP